MVAVLLIARATATYNVSLFIPEEKMLKMILILSDAHIFM